MTGYKSKKSMAQDKLEALAQPTLQEQLDKAKADWDKAHAVWDKAHAVWDKAHTDWYKANADWKKAGTDWDKADAELRRVKKLMEQQDDQDSAMGYTQRSI